MHDRIRRLFPSTITQHRPRGILAGSLESLESMLSSAMTEDESKCVRLWRGREAAAGAADAKHAGWSVVAWSNAGS